MRRFALGLALAVVLPLFAAGQEPAADEKDYTDAAPADLGLEWAAPHKEKTGFLVGGVNATKLLRTLPSLNGVGVEKLEKEMRPGVNSKAGFLGKDENLLDILAADNDFVRGELGRTHQELARPLLVAVAVGKKDTTKLTTFRYHGGRYRVAVKGFRGFVESPFQDETQTNLEAIVENVKTGAKLKYSQLVPIMVERYGFYEGKGTPYRVDPRQIVAVFDHLKKAK